MINYTDQFDIKAVICSGKIIWQGRNGFEWTNPNRFALRTMFQLKNNGESTLKIHRDAGLEKTKVLAMNSNY